MIHGIYLSSDTEMTVSLVNSETHDTVWCQYVGANGGSLVGGSPWVELAKTAMREGLDYTTSANGNVFLAVAYELWP